MFLKISVISYGKTVSGCNRSLKLIICRRLSRLINIAIILPQSQPHITSSNTSTNMLQPVVTDTPPQAQPAVQVLNLPGHPQSLLRLLHNHINSDIIHLKHHLSSRRSKRSGPLTSPSSELAQALLAATNIPPQVSRHQASIETAVQVLNSPATYRGCSDFAQSYHI